MQDTETPNKVANKLLTKLLNDSKKDNARLKETNQNLQKRISELEQECKNLEEKLQTQEALWIKAFDMMSPKKKGSEGVNTTFPAPDNSTAKPKPQVQRGKQKANYKQNMKTMIHQKYMKKLEDQQILHEKQLHELR